MMRGQPLTSPREAFVPFTLASLSRTSTAVAAGLLAAGLLAVTTEAPSDARVVDRGTHRGAVTVHRGGHDATVRFQRSQAGEVLLHVGVSARGVSWAERNNESAVVSVFVDGHYATDIVIMSSGLVTRQLALGRLGVGRHTLRLHYAAKRSESRAGVARLQDFTFTTVQPTNPAYAVARYAPVLYGRNVAGLGGRFQNNRTDTPLVAWHQVLPADTPGHSIIEYSVMWSNEDQGTNTALLMGRWGRTTDIEWVYRVEVDAQGHRVAGTGVFQGAGHGTTPFAGRYAGTHPLLETCTGNNNVCDKVDDPMRFALSFRGALPADQAREHEMDVHPWTYQVTSREMLREHKIESPSDPATIDVGDQRSYLYIALDHDVVPASSAETIGLAVDVTLNGGATFHSDHLIAIVTIQHDGPAATTVELPLGTTLADLQSISVRRVPFGADDASTTTVTELQRAFFLTKRYLPGPSLAPVHDIVVLSTASPTALIWEAP
jgi:hypothetical protein